MLNRIWNWLKQFFQRLFSFSPWGARGDRTVPSPLQSTQPLTDAEYEANFIQLLAGVNEGWSRGSVKGFLSAKQIADADWIAWLRRFEEKLLAVVLRADESSPSQVENSSVSSLRELAQRLVKFSELYGEELGEVAGQIGRQLLTVTAPPASLEAAIADNLEETNRPDAESAEEEKEENLEKSVVSDRAPIPDETNRLDAEGWFDRGNERYMSGEFEEAIACYDRAIALKVNKYEAWVNRGYSLDNLGRYEEAIAAYDRAVAIQPDLHEAWNNRGVSLADLGRYEAAIASYDRAVAIAVDYPEAWFNRGNSLSDLGEYEAAIASYDRALDLKPDLYAAWYNKGLALKNLGRIEEAIAAYDRTLSLNPNFDEAWFNRGNSLSDLGRIEEAIASYSRALTLKADYLEAWYNQGVSLNDLERYEEAISAYDRALNLKADFDEAWYNRGISLHNLGHYEEAIASFDRALTIKPDLDEAWYSRSVSLANLRRYEEAIASFDRSLTITIDKWESWIGRGYAAANSIYQPHPLQNPLLTSSPLELENPVRNQRGYEGQLASYQEGLKYCPHDTHPEGWGKLHRAIGEAHFFRGRGDARRRYYWNLAIKSYDKALETLTETAFPEAYLEVLQSLIRALVALGEKDRAEELHQQGMDLLQSLLNDSQRSPWKKKQLALQFAGFNQLTVDILLQKAEKLQALEIAEAGKNACLMWLMHGWNDDIKTPNYADIQQLLNPSTAIVYWHQSPAALTTFILKSDASEPIVLADAEFFTRLEEFEGWVKEWNQQYEDYRYPKQQQGAAEETERENHPWIAGMEERLNRLKEILNIGAIVEELSGIVNLILIPHRDLHPLPLESLFPDNFTLTRLPSAQFGITLQQSDRTFSMPTLLSIEPPNREDFSPLPLAEIESFAIAQMLTTIRLGDTETTLDGVKNALKQPHRRWHFVGYSVGDRSHPALSYLALTGNEKLTLADVLDLNLSSYRLVSLSACEIAFTRNQTITTEYVGLASGFMSAGVAALLSTLWVVRSDATALLNMQFYRQLKKGRSEAVALKNAVKWLKQLTPKKLIKLYQKMLSKLPPEADDLLYTFSREINQLAALKKDEKLFANPYHWAAYTLAGLF